MHCTMASTCVSIVVTLHFLLLSLVLSDMTSLEDLETSLQSNPLNIESIDDAFYPLNIRPSIVVNVSYFVNETENGTATVPVHPLAMSSTDRDLLTPNYTLQWVSYRVLLPFGPTLLPSDIFSQAVDPSVVMLVIPPICNSSQQQSYVCSDIRIKKLLTRLTSKVSVTIMVHVTAAC